MLGQVERYFRQSIVDKDEHVQASALVSALFMLEKGGVNDVIGRWAGELQSILQSGRGETVPFLALALLRSIRKTDKLAITKLIQTLKGTLRSPMALVLLIRYSVGLLSDPDTPATVTQSCISFMNLCLRSSYDMVMLEAARALTSLPPSITHDLSPAVTLLDTFLSSPHSVQRYAAIKTLAQLAKTHPSLVAQCNEVLETLINDSSRAIGTLAISTLLKTGSESSVDKLIKQIAAFMVDVNSDELKISIVQAVHELAFRFPSKHRSIQSFLSSALRDEGGYDFKKAVLDALLNLMEAIPEAKTEGLFHCCEFIEDCEFTALATRVLHLLGKEGPLLPPPQPAAFIRFIYNRVILESAPVRASAVSALAKFAARCEDLRSQIIPLLQRCLDDDDDEVRDRATVFLELLGASSTPNEAHIEALTRDSVQTAKDGHLVLKMNQSNNFDVNIAKALTSGTLPLPVAALQKSLQLYQMRPSTGVFSFESLPHVEVSSAHGAGAEGFGFLSEAKASEEAGKGGKGKPGRTPTSDGSTSGAGASATPSAVEAANAAAEALYAIPQFASFGPLFRSSRTIDLTEKELEYLVQVQKHIFQNRIVFGFTITNTIPEVVLERVTMALTPSEPDAYSQVMTIDVPRIREGAPGVAYVVFARNSEAGFPPCTFTTEMRFYSKECDPTNDYETFGDAIKEEYPVNDLELTSADFFAATPIADFRGGWEALANVDELQETFALSFKTVAEATSAVIETLGLAPCEGTGLVKPSATRHGVFLSGKFIGNIPVLARMLIATTEGQDGCILRIAIRSPDSNVSEILMNSIS